MRFSVLTGLLLSMGVMSVVTTTALAGKVPDVDYVVAHVQIAGGGADEKGTIMMEKQTGRSWLLMQRGSAQPTWQALPFEPGFALNQQTLPPDVSRVYDRMERDSGN